jgi:transcriptional regulator with XRE-family HTH domain
MSTMMDPTPIIAARIRAAREVRGWSLADLAAHSGVSRAMISKIERGEASPTAALLARLSGALEMTMSALLAGAETAQDRVIRAANQPVWTDPATGYVRRSVNPPTGFPIDVVEVVLPAGAVVAAPASSYAFLRHLIWVREGELRFIEGGHVHQLGPGDCLELGEPSDCAYENRSAAPCRYVVIVLRRER